MYSPKIYIKMFNIIKVMLKSGRGKKDHKKKINFIKYAAICQILR